MREGGSLLALRAAVVLVVWKDGIGFELVAGPASAIGLPAATLDISTALEIDRRLLEAAESQAQRGVAIARDAGLEAEPLVVADDPDAAVHETILRVARDRDAASILMGAHGHGPVAQMLLGGTTRGVLRQAEVPVMVVRHAASER